VGLSAITDEVTASRRGAQEYLVIKLPLLPVAGLLGLSLVACSGSSKDADDTTPKNGIEACEGEAASASVPCHDNPDPCGLKSGFPGDEYCILPPPPGKGIQIHFGPKSYTDPAEIAKYVLKAGEEFNSYGTTPIPVDGERWYNYTQIRMRPGSHHLINTVVQGENIPEGFAPQGQTCEGTTVAGFPGTQNLVRNMPPRGQHAPENVGLGSMLPPNSHLCVNHHAYNYSHQDQLREVWINVWFVDASEVTQRSSGVMIVAGPWAGILPYTQTTLTAETAITGEGRIVSLFGHRHAWTERFAVWKNDQLIYDSWDWEESAVFNYDSITTNPAPNPDAKTDGAVSGMMEVVPGDTIKIQCDIDNQSDKTLYFRNALYEGEMCILFGSAVGTSIRGGRLPGGGEAG
jgi:hypothetical protein